MTIEINAVPNYDLAASWATFASGEYEVDTDGTRTWKLADDLDRYRAIIEATKPEVIVETGTKFGGSARWFKSLGLDVITVDIDDTYSGETRRPPRHPLDHRGYAGTGRTRLRGRPDRRTAHDGVPRQRARHTARPGRNRPLQLTGHPGCYLVVEDGIFDLIEPERAHLGVLAFRRKAAHCGPSPRRLRRTQRHGSATRPSRRCRPGRTTHVGLGQGAEGRTAQGDRTQGHQGDAGGCAN